MNRFVPRDCGSSDTLIRMSKTTDSIPLLSPDLLARLERLELVSRKVFRGRMKGERRSKRKGQSVEFADFRNYVPGDDIGICTRGSTNCS